jgi:hypothetical protein
VGDFACICTSTIIGRALRSPELVGGAWDKKNIDWWWGEGDEKFFVDGEQFPSTFGTGSEDYVGTPLSPLPGVRECLCGSVVCAHRRQRRNLGSGGAHLTTYRSSTASKPALKKYKPNVW